MYEELYINALKSKCDISTCILSYKKNDKIINPFKDKCDISQVTSSLQLLNKIYDYDYTNSLCICVCTKIFKKHIFNKIRFEDGIYEDDEISPRILINNYKISIDTKPMYVYVQNIKSTTNKPFSKKNLIFLNILIEREKLFNNAGLYELEQKTVKLYFDILIEYYIKSLELGLSCNMIYYLNYSKRNVSKVIFNRSISIKSKLRYILFLFSPKLYMKIIN